MTSAETRERRSESMSLARSRDLIVVGGGAARTAAAIGAASVGAQTVLVESGPFLEGAATLRNVLTYCDLFYELSEETVYATA